MLHPVPNSSVDAMHRDIPPIPASTVPECPVVASRGTARGLFQQGLLVSPRLMAISCAPRCRKQDRQSHGGGLFHHPFQTFGLRGERRHEGPSCSSCGGCFLLIPCPPRVRIRGSAVAAFTSAFPNHPFFPRTCSPIFPSAMRGCRAVDAAGWCRASPFPVHRVGQLLDSRVPFLVGTYQSRRTTRNLLLPSRASPTYQRGVRCECSSAW